jgi:hypothetical protein
VEAATRADLEAFMVDEEELESDPMAKMRPPIVPANPVPIVPADGLKRLFGLKLTDIARRTRQRSTSQAPAGANHDRGPARQVTHDRPLLMRFRGPPRFLTG